MGYVIQFNILSYGSKFFIRYKYNIIRINFENLLNSKKMSLN